MVKNRIYQIIYHFVEVAFGVTCILVSLGVISSGKIPNSIGQFDVFYLFFTNLSNYAIILYAFIELGFTVYQYLKEGKQGITCVSLPVKYSLMIGVLLTMVVANTLLGSMMGFIWEAKWWSNYTNPFLHFLNPLLFIFDFAFFSPIGKVNKKYPFYSIIFPLAYLAFIFTRAAIITSNDPSYSGTLYPYPFINVSTQGWGITICYIVALVAIFILIGYLIWFIDKKRYKRITSLNHQA